MLQEKTTSTATAALKALDEHFLAEAERQSQDDPTDAPPASVVGRDATPVTPEEYATLQIIRDTITGDPGIRTRIRRLSRSASNGTADEIQTILEKSPIWMDDLIDNLSRSIWGGPSGKPAGWLPLLESVFQGLIDRGLVGEPDRNPDPRVVWLTKAGLHALTFPPPVAGGSGDQPKELAGGPPLIGEVFMKNLENDKAYLTISQQRVVVRALENFEYMDLTDDAEVAADLLLNWNMTKTFDDVEYRHRCLLTRHHVDAIIETVVDAQKHISKDREFDRIRPNRKTLARVDALLKDVVRMLGVVKPEGVSR